MNIVDNKKQPGQKHQDNREIKPKTHKIIGLAEQVQEARRLFRLLENPELLKQQLK